MRSVMVSRQRTLLAQVELSYSLSSQGQKDGGQLQASLHGVLYQFYMLLRRGLVLRAGISTELIKKQLQRNLKQTGPRPSVPQYPRTFEQKVVLLNDARTIQKLQIVEYGVKYKPSKKYLWALLGFAAFFFYLNEQVVPVRVTDTYFTISNLSGWDHPSGFLWAGLKHEQPFYFYLPLLAVVGQLSKFVSNRWIIGLIGVNSVINGALGCWLVEERVGRYQVWDQERVCYGQSNWISLSMMLWSSLGMKNGFTSLKSRLFLRAIPGLGIIRAGLPLGYLCLFYLLWQSYHWYFGKKNTELTAASVVTGVLMGLAVRRWAPLK